MRLSKFLTIKSLLLQIYPFKFWRKSPRRFGGVFPLSPREGSQGEGIPILSSWLWRKKISHESTFKPPASHPSWSRNAKEDPGKLDLIGVGLGVTWLRTLEPYEQKCYRSSGGHERGMSMFFIPLWDGKTSSSQIQYAFYGPRVNLSSLTETTIFCEIKVELPHGESPPP